MTIVVDRTAALTGTDDGNSNGDINYRVIFAASELGAATGNTASVKVRFGTGQGTLNVVITGMFIGQAAAAGDTYDFLNAPTRVTWGGNNDIDGAAASVQTSDVVTLPEAYDETKRLIVSFHASSTIQFNSSLVTSGAVEDLWYKVTGGDEAGVQNATGYTNAGTANFQYFIEEIDIPEAAGGQPTIKRMGGVKFAAATDYGTW